MKQKKSLFALFSVLMFMFFSIYALPVFAQDSQDAGVLFVWPDEQDLTIGVRQTAWNSFVFMPQGIAESPDIFFDWEFGDGLMAEGYRIEHEYAESGNYPVLLRISTRNGDERVIQTNIRIPLFYFNNPVLWKYLGGLVIISFVLVAIAFWWDKKKNVREEGVLSVPEVEYYATQSQDPAESKNDEGTEVLGLGDDDFVELDVLEKTLKQTHKALNANIPDKAGVYKKLKKTTETKNVRSPQKRTKSHVKKNTSVTSTKNRIEMPFLEISETENNGVFKKKITRNKSVRKKSEIEKTAYRHATSSKKTAKKNIQKEKKRVPKVDAGMEV